jgi:hypothetical protein
LTTAGPALLAIGSPAANAAPAHAAAPAPELPAAIRAVMDKPRYQDARCSQLVVDVKSGETVHALDPGGVSFTGSTRSDAGRTDESAAGFPQIRERRRSRSRAGADTSSSRKRKPVAHVLEAHRDTA